MDQTRHFCKIVDKSVQEQSLQTINKYFSGTTDDSKIFNSRTISYFTKMLKKEGKHEDKTLHITCVLRCLQYFLEVTDCVKWEQMSENISKLCELLFVITAMFIKDEELILKNINVFSAIVEHIPSLADNIVRYMLESLLNIALSPTFANSIQLIMFGFIGSLLQKSSRKMRSEVLPSITDQLGGLSNYLLLCGDYETQVSTVEILARCWTHIKETKHDTVLFSNNPKILHIFNKYNFLNFDPDCRLFLNELNKEMGDKQRVFSIPCMVVCNEKLKFKKPNDPSYKDFWVDFNLGSKSISFYYISSASDGWEVMNLYESNIVLAVAKNSCCRSKTGEIISAVKIEITIKDDPTKPDTSIFRLYPIKTAEFKELERTAIKEILQDKYQSNVTYADIFMPSTSSPLHSKSVPEKPPKLNTILEADSFLEVDTTNLPQPAVDGSDSSDLVGASPLPSTTTFEHREFCGKSEATAKTSSDSEDDSRDSDIFSQHIGKLLQNADQPLALENSRLGTEVLKGVNLPDNKKNMQLIKNPVPDIKDSDDKDGNKDSIGIGIKRKKSSNIQISDHRNATTENFTEQIPSDEQVLKMEETGSNLQFNKAEHKENSHILQISSKTTSKKRRLYSSDPNQTKDLVLSSQEICSVEPPSYKFKKTNVSVSSKQNVKRENITYSYISYKEKQNNKSVNESSIYTDHHENEHSDGENLTKTNKTQNCDRFKSPLCSKFFCNNEKKLVDLNKTPESTKKSKLFPSRSLYSDMSSSGRENRVKKTYARLKPKKGSRRRKVVPIVSSDSDSDSKAILKRPEIKEPIPSDNDSDYIPSDTKTHLAANKTEKSFVYHLRRKKIDPIRDTEVEDEMELDPINIDEPILKPREIEIRVPLKRSRAKKCTVQAENQKKDNNKNSNSTNKKEQNKNKKGQKRKEPELLEKLAVEISESPEFFDLVNYNPTMDDGVCYEELTLDVLSGPVFHDQNLTQTTFKIGEVIQFGKCLLMQACNRIQKMERLALKEREMHFATYDYKCQASCSEINTSCKKMEVVINNLTKIKNLLETTWNLQNEIPLQICNEASNIEKAKQELLKNIVNIEKSERSNIASIFQGLSRYIRKIFFTFIQRNTTSKKAISN